MGKRSRITCNVLILLCRSACEHLCVSAEKHNNITYAYAHVRMALVGPCRPLSLFRRCRIRDSARECTGRGRNGSSPSPRVFLLSALFVEAVQSCRRRCAVQRCSNRRIAIRNHASNRRRRRLVQTSNEPTT